MHRATLLLAVTVACGTNSSPAETPLPSACAGLVPALTNGASYTIPGPNPSLPTSCAGAVGDGSGNIYAAASSGATEETYNRTTGILAFLAPGPPLRAGFTGVTAASDGSPVYVGFNPD